MIETDSAHQPFEVADLDRQAVLDLFDDAEQLDRLAQRRKLRLVHQWAVLNAAGPGVEPATYGECDDPIAGEGAPFVAGAAVSELGARLGVSGMTAQSLLADALDLAHRLPRVHERVERLEVPAWKARKVAVLTRSLSFAAAGLVDDQLAGRLHEVGFVTIGRVIDVAVAVFHPERIDEDPSSDKAHWRVDLRHPINSTVNNSWLDATADTLDLIALHDLVGAVAEALRKAGDDDTLDQRKAKALGVIGRGEHLALLERAGTASPSAPRTKIYVHVGSDDLASTDDPEAAIGHVEGLGAATVSRIREWAGRPDVRIQPLLRTDATSAVDRHDPPEWMADVVRLRDPHCVFPGCQRNSRACDLDHIEPYTPHGPPGQTHPGNLAPLCRRHHNTKTHHGWRYRRLPDGSYLWRGPSGDQFMVTVHSSVIVPAS